MRHGTHSWAPFRRTRVLQEQQFTVARVLVVCYIDELQRGQINGQKYAHEYECSKDNKLACYFGPYHNFGLSSDHKFALQ
jgi:hypothetical protein